MIWNESAERMSREDMLKLQLERLKETVRRVYEKVPYYRAKLDKANISPDDIKSLDDIAKIPFTVKDDLRQNYPYQLFAVPMREILRIHASSGTTGKPTVVGYTRN
ncbi:MAG TPA: phenylacetate--CoA ligase, partial [Clostridia bacterium]|nr:phenylacetate--CoA ligase [Clostridia bacterium]